MVLFRNFLMVELFLHIAIKNSTASSASGILPRVIRVVRVPSWRAVPVGKPAAVECGADLMSADAALVRVLVADDQKVVRDDLSLLLGMLPGVEVIGTAVDGKATPTGCGWAGRPWHVVRVASLGCWGQTSLLARVLSLCPVPWLAAPRVWRGAAYSMLHADCHSG